MINKKFPTIILAITVLLVSTTIYARGKYGTAGCGLGAVIIGEGDGFVQVFAISSNIIYGLQAFAITSGTSECTDSFDQAAIKELKQKVYVYKNYDNLKKDIARGRGESLKSFANLLGCANSSINSFSKITQSKFAIIYDGKDDPSIMLNRVKKIIIADNTLATSCKIS